MKRWLLVPALVGVVGVYAAFDDAAGIRNWLDLRSELSDAQGRLDDSRREIEQLRHDAAALEDDPIAIERAVRESLGLAKPGETIVRVTPSDGSNPRIP